MRTEDFIPVLLIVAVMSCTLVGCDNKLIRPQGQMLKFNDMKKGFFAPLAVALFLPLLFCCSSETKQVYLECGTTEYVKDFPKTVDVKETDLLQLNIDLTGCVDFFLADTLLVCKYVNKDHFWDVCLLTNLSSKERLLRKGHGRHEFMYIPGSEFVNISDTGVTCDFLAQNNVFYRCNLTKSIDNGQLCVYEIHTESKLDDVFYISALNDSTFFVKRSDGFCFRREILAGGQRKEIANIGNLNKVRATEDINTVSFVAYVNKQKGMVAEAMLYLNQINLYSIFDSAHQNKTICIGDELMNVAKVDDMSKRKKRWTFAKIKSYSDYFVMLYQNATEKELYDSGRNSCLLVFDWNGTPVLKLTIPFMASSFDISDRGDVYIFDNYGRQEKIYFYKNINDLI